MPKPQLQTTKIYVAIHTTSGSVEEVFGESLDLITFYSTILGVCPLT
jgi:hypothetical protein